MENSEQTQHLALQPSGYTVPDFVGPDGEVYGDETYVTNVQGTNGQDFVAGITIVGIVLILIGIVVLIKKGYWATSGLVSALAAIALYRIIDLFMLGAYNKYDWLILVFISFSIFSLILFLFGFWRLEKTVNKFKKSNEIK